MRRAWAAAPLAVALALAPACQMRDLDAQKYVTIPEAETATQAASLHVEKDSSGDFVYARPDRTAVLRVRVAAGAEYKSWKTAPEQLRAPVPGLGDDAFDGPLTGSEPPFIAIVKDNRAVKITGNVPYETLKSLATTAASRM